MNNDLPQIFILRTGKHEAQHDGHVDAVLGDPEQLLRRALFNDVLEFRRVGMQVFRNFRSSNARSAMTIRAAVLQKFARTGLNACRVCKIARRSILGMAVDRSGANLDQRPFHDGRFFRRPCDSVEAAKKEHSDNSRADDCECASGRQYPHHILRCAAKFSP